MKKSLFNFVLIMGILLCLTGCRGRQCEVIGCRMERSVWSDYCVEHRCRNVDCQNKGAGSFAYCQECADMY